MDKIKGIIMKRFLLGLAIAASGAISGVSIAYTTSVGMNSNVCKPGTDHCFQCVRSGGREWCRHCEGTKCSTWLPQEPGPGEPGGV